MHLSTIINKLGQFGTEFGGELEPLLVVFRFGEELIILTQSFERRQENGLCRDGLLVQLLALEVLPNGLTRRSLSVAEGEDGVHDHVNVLVLHLVCILTAVL